MIDTTAVTVHAGGGMRVRVHLHPPGGWCLGSYSGRIIETVTAVCAPNHACPQIMMVHEIGTFTFLVHTPCFPPVVALPTHEPQVRRGPTELISGIYLLGGPAIIGCPGSPHGPLAGTLTATPVGTASTAGTATAARATASVGTQTTVASATSVGTTASVQTKAPGGETTSVQTKAPGGETTSVGTTTKHTVVRETLHKAGELFRLHLMPGTYNVQATLTGNVRTRPVRVTIPAGRSVRQDVFVLAF